MSDRISWAELPSEAKILWGDRSRPPRGRPPRLNLDRIVDAAIGIADTDGLPALSMQRLATDLGFGTMSLYRYVDTKAALTALMLDTAIGPPEDFASAGTWRAGLQRWAHQNLAIFHRHPWTLPLVTTGRIMGPNETAHLDAALRTISGLGLSATAMLDTILLVNGFVRGAAQHSVPATPQEVELSGSAMPRQGSPTASTLDQLGQRDHYPTLAAVMDAVDDELSTGHDPMQGFEFGLSRILDGLEAHLADTTSMR